MGWFWYPWYWTLYSGEVPWLCEPYAPLYLKQFWIDGRCLIPRVSTHPLLVWWSAWTWLITYGRPMEIGSQVWNLWSNKPWPKSWKPILLVMYFGNAFARDCNFTHLSRLSLIWTAKYIVTSDISRSVANKCSQNYSELFSNQIICQYFFLSTVSPSSFKLHPSNRVCRRH